MAESKIKEAHSLALSGKLSEVVSDPHISGSQALQESRAAGRQAQIETVSSFLENARIDHVIEVTMAGFIQVAETVAPKSVCLNNETEDYYSQADFPAGIEESNAAQAMTFVRVDRQAETGSDVHQL